MSQMAVAKLDKALAAAPQITAETNIHLFCEKGDLAALQKAIAAGEAPEKRNTRRQTPLHCACVGAHAEVVQYLLSLSVDIEARDATLVTPMHCAAAGGSSECCKLLCAKRYVHYCEDMIHMHDVVHCHVVSLPRFGYT